MSGRAELSPFAVLPLQVAAMRRLAQPPAGGGFGFGGDLGTKPRQAQAMVSRAIDAGVPIAWFTTDEAYVRPSTCRPGWRTRTCPR